MFLSFLLLFGLLVEDGSEFINYTIWYINIRYSIYLFLAGDRHWLAEQRLQQHIVHGDGAQYEGGLSRGGGFGQHAEQFVL